MNTPTPIKTGEPCPSFLKRREASMDPLSREAQEIAETVLNNAPFLRKQGKFDDALVMCQRAREVSERVLGPGHPKTIFTISNVASLLQNQGKFGEAPKMYQREREVSKRALGPLGCHKSIPIVRNIGSLFQEKMEFDKALEIYQRELEMTEIFLGPRYPKTISIVRDIGSLFQKEGMFDEALEMYQRALEVSERFHGPEHPETIYTISSVASLLQNQGRFDEALKMYQRAREVSERVLGPEHPNTISIVRDIGSLFQGQGKPDEALEMYQRALKVPERVPGPEHSAPGHPTIINETGQILGGRLEMLASSSQRCLSPQLTEESDFSQDLSAPPMPVVNDEYLWATRFSDGKTHIIFEIARRWDLSNGIKRWVEDFIREPINWWPLSPQRHSAPQGYVYVKWKCRCGRRISSIIRKERMHQYHMYQRFRSHSGSSSSSNNRSSPPNVPAQPIANSANSNTLNNGTLVNPILPSIAFFPGATPSSMTGQGVRDKLLMWCINLGSKATVVRELRVSPSDNDEAIFRSLRAEYLRVRSWRRWFSLYTISYIRFVKFRLYRLDHMRVSCYNKEEMPTPNHPYYEYRPETVDVPPVPTEELMEYFEDPSCIGTTSITLDALPKKTNGTMSLQEKYGWGLRACEALSFFRILILFLIIQAGPIAFFIYWLGGHPGDIQNASVPLFLAFALMGTFIVFPTITEVISS